MGRSRGRRCMLGTPIPYVDWRPSTHYLVPRARREECRVPWLRLILTHPREVVVLIISFTYRQRIQVK